MTGIYVASTFCSSTISMGVIVTVLGELPSYTFFLLRNQRRSMEIIRRGARISARLDHINLY